MNFIKYSMLYTQKFRFVLQNFSFILFFFKNLIMNRLQRIYIIEQTLKWYFFNPSYQAPFLCVFLK